MSESVVRRRPRGELKNAIRQYLADLGSPASVSEITAGVRDVVGEAAASSYRSALQDERYFERVQRGVFRLRE